MDSIFDKIIKNLQRLDSENNEIIIKDGERIGPSKGLHRNQRTGIHLSDTSEEAESYEIYTDMMDGKDINPADLDDEMMNKIRAHIIQDIFLKDIIG